MTIQVLLVEDQSGLLDTFHHFLPKAFARVAKEFTLDEVHSYASAQHFISKNQYDSILLDHRLPSNDSEELERINFTAFSESLQDIGYALAPEIRRRNRTALLTGTSSVRVSTKDLDYTISKDWDDFLPQFSAVLSKELSNFPT